MQDDKYDDSIDLDGVDYAKWWKVIIILAHISCIITSKFK